MSLCEPVTSGFSESELSAVYPGPLAISPNPSPPDSDRTADEFKMLKPEALTRIVTDLKTRGTLPPAPAFNQENINEVAASYRDKLNALKESLKAEYCWYYRRYSYAIQQWIYAIADTGASSNTGNINKYGAISISINRRLMDLTSIINAVSRDLYNTASKSSDEINSLNTQLNEQFGKLKKQAEVLQAEAPQAEMKKRMVEFTREKAKANNNLLSFYFFLDVVALGILFYVYKAGGQ